jgi:flagellar basal-body rod protein FlgG
MIDSLYIGATGMNAQQLNIDTVANNLANVNTTGFKRSRVSFEDLLYRQVQVAPSAVADRPAMGRMGMGTAVAGSSKIFSAGEIKKTDQPLDLAIDGQGFFEIVMPDGSLAYTRNGALRLDSDGFLATQDGHRLSAQVKIPPDALQVRIDETGTVFAKLPDEAKEVESGRIELATFPNPGGLTAIGDNLYSVTEQSGTAVPGTPGQAGLGAVRQGFLEGSNVSLIDELLGLVLAQRAYELNAKVVQASDELLSMANNLRR